MAMRCYFCGREQGPNARGFCLSCGRPLTATPASELFGRRYILNRLDDLARGGVLDEDSAERVRRAMLLELGEAPTPEPAAPVASSPVDAVPAVESRPVPSVRPAVTAAVRERPAAPSPIESLFTPERAPSLLLYLGAFLVVVAALIFVNVSREQVSDAVRLALMIVGTLGFLGAGLLCHRVPRVEEAGRTFIVIGALLVPVDFAAYYVLVAHESPLTSSVMWIVGSLWSAGLYGGLATNRYGTAYAYLFFAACLSAIAGILAWSDTVAWAGALFAGLALAIQLVDDRAGRTALAHLTRPLLLPARVLVAVALVVGSSIALAVGLGVPAGGDRFALSALGVVGLAYYVVRARLEIGWERWLAVAGPAAVAEGLVFAFGAPLQTYGFAAGILAVCYALAGELGDLAGQPTPLAGWVRIRAVPTARRRGGFERGAGVRLRARGPAARHDPRRARRRRDRRERRRRPPPGRALAGRRVRRGRRLVRRALARPTRGDAAGGRGPRGACHLRARVPATLPCGSVRARGARDRRLAGRRRRAQRARVRVRTIVRRRVALALGYRRLVGDRPGGLGLRRDRGRRGAASSIAEPRPRGHALVPRLNADDRREPRGRRDDRAHAVRAGPDRLARRSAAARGCRGDGRPAAARPTARPRDGVRVRRAHARRERPRRRNGHRRARALVGPEGALRGGRDDAWLHHARLAQPHRDDGAVRGRRRGGDRRAGSRHPAVSTAPAGGRARMGAGDPRRRDDRRQPARSRVRRCRCGPGGSRARGGDRAARDRSSRSQAGAPRRGIRVGRHRRGVDPRRSLRPAIPRDRGRCRARRAVARRGALSRGRPRRTCAHRSRVAGGLPLRRADAARLVEHRFLPGDAHRLLRDRLDPRHGDPVSSPLARRRGARGPRPRGAARNDRRGEPAPELGAVRRERGHPPRGRLRPPAEARSLEPVVASRVRLVGPALSAVARAVRRSRAWKKTRRSNSRTSVPRSSARASPPNAVVALPRRATGPRRTSRTRRTSTRSASLSGAARR